MQKIILCEYSLSGITTDAQEESYQSLEFSRMFDESEPEVLETSAGIPADDIVFQLMVTNKLLGILVAFQLMLIAFFAIKCLSRYVTNILKYS